MEAIDNPSMDTFQSMSIEELVEMFNNSDRDNDITDEFIRRRISVVDIQRASYGRPLKIWYDASNNAIHVKERHFFDMWNPELWKM